MLPSLTVRGRRLRLSRWRFAAAGCGLVLAAFAAAMPGVATEAPAAPVASLAARLPPSSWGFAVPTVWFATPLTGIRVGDRIDVLALKASDRPSAAAIAYDLEVMSIDERTLVVGVNAFDATAIATARAAGQLIVPLLRSER